MSTTYPSCLSDAEWNYLQPYLPLLPRRARPRTHLLRRILDAIFYMLRTGCAWVSGRDLPSSVPYLKCVGPGEEGLAQGRRLTEIVLGGIRCTPERRCSTPHRPPAPRRERHGYDSQLPRRGAVLDRVRVQPRRAAARRGTAQRSRPSGSLRTIRWLRRAVVASSPVPS